VIDTGVSLSVSPVKEDFIGECLSTLLTELQYTPWQSASLPLDNEFVNPKNKLQRQSDLPGGVENDWRGRE
jgi:hypothetical protein